MEQEKSFPTGKSACKKSLSFRKIKLTSLSLAMGGEAPSGKG